jgi:hypothetical protein
MIVIDTGGIRRRARRGGGTGTPALVSDSGNRSSQSMVSSIERRGRASLSSRKLVDEADLKRDFLAF